MISTSALLIVTALALGSVDGVAVTDRDAEQIRAMLSPPPSREAAQRLALDATRAHLWLRGWVEYSSLRARLEAYRVLVATARRQAKSQGDLAQRVEQALASTKQGWHLPLRRLDPPQHHEWLEATHPGLGDPLDMSLVRFDRAGGVETLELGPVHLYQLDPSLARYVASSTAPQLKKPFVDASGRRILITLAPVT
ncbi:MAG: hypothetical protein U0V87_01720 [Acidobacteriota bacterium]